MTESFEEAMNASLNLTFRARQLLVDIGLKEPSGDPPEIVAQYDTLVDSVADHLRQVAAETVKERDDFAVTVVNLARQRESLRALLAEAGEALKWYADEGSEKFRIVDSTGSVIAKFADFGDRARAALEPIQSALRDASPTMGKPK